MKIKKINIFLEYESEPEQQEEEQEPEEVEYEEDEGFIYNDADDDEITEGPQLACAKMETMRDMKVSGLLTLNIYNGYYPCCFLVYLTYFNILNFQNFD